MHIAQSDEAVENTDCIAEVGYSLNKCAGYDIKQSDDEAPVLELWVRRSTPSLPLLPGSLWSRVVAPDRVISMG